MAAPGIVHRNGAARRTATDARHRGKSTGQAGDQLRFECRNQVRRLGQNHSSSDQSASGDESAAAMIRANLLVDSHGRILRDLRVSVTDRCNFRCLYCLPETEAAQNFYRGHWAHMPAPAPIVQQWMPKSNILSYEEIERVVRIASDLGIQKIRLTGGEPLLRPDVEKLVARIASIPGLTDLAMTTNGSLFPQKGRANR